MKDFTMKTFSLNDLAGMYSLAIEREAVKDKLIHDLKKDIKRAIYCIEVLQDEYDDTCKETLELLRELGK
jgi:hypothetical protein